MPDTHKKEGVSWTYDTPSHIFDKLVLMAFLTSFSIPVSES